MSRWTVPVFVMISGALFLSKESNIKKLYTKNIFRIVTAFLVWAIIYAVLFEENLDIKTIIVKMISGHYHMWFLPLIIGLYMLVPVLKKVVSDEKIMKYFLLLTLIITFIVPQILNLMSDMQSAEVSKIVDLFKTNWINNMGLKFGYTGYFVLGYYLSKIELSKKARRIIYFLGIIGLLLTIGLTIFSSNIYSVWIQKYYDNCTVNVLLEAIAIFVFFKYNFVENKAIQNISKCTFGIYLVHVLIIEKFGKIFMFNVSNFNPIFSVPVVCTIVFGTSLLISFILNKVPILKKYIV